MKKICIRTNVLKTNKGKKIKEPPIVIQDENGVSYAHRVEIKGPSTVVYNPDSPLEIGAVVWIETESEIEAGID